MQKARVEAIDILRGILACAVMFYHYVTWYKPPWPEALGGALETIGVYSVEAFFVVSGFSLYYAYRDRRDFLSYVRNRVLRLWPVYVLAVAGCVWLTPNLSPAQIAENVTLLFGFYDANRALPIGGWSIAVEVVLSALAPLFIVLTAHRLRRATVLFGLTFVVMCAWAFAMPATWATHIHPMNHLMFFVAGMIFAEVRLRRWELRPWSFRIIMTGTLVGALVVSLFASAGWESVSFGPIRVVMSLATLAFVGAWAFKKYENPSRVALAIGASSYSIYLLHPIFWGALIRGYTSWWVPIVAALLTIALSLVCYRFFERPIIDWGKQWSKRATASP
jgi:peptidoglycan/LPS O-acetylase OafA/YrhL